MNQFKIPSVFAQRLLDHGLVLEQVLRAGRLPPGLFAEDKILISTDQLFRLWQAIGDLSGDAAIGLAIGGDTRIERFDPVSIAALCARTFRDALQRLARYKETVCPEQVSLTEMDSALAVEFRWLKAKTTEPPLLLDAAFASLHALRRRGTGQALSPLRVEFTRAPPPGDLYARHFECEVRFNQARNAVVYSRDSIDQPLVTYNADMFAVLGTNLENELHDYRAQENIADQLRVVIRKLLAGQRPNIENTASELAISSRTLQRKLTAAGVSFQQLLAEIRRDLAAHYLRESTLELSEVAYLLGYEDANSFNRAFQGWEGQPPGRWRNAQAKPSVATV